jgi:DNA-binding response OmpR family regulator
MTTDNEKAAELLRELLEQQGIKVDGFDVEVAVREEGVIKTEEYSRFINDLHMYGLMIADLPHDTEPARTQVHEMQAAITVAVAGLTAVEAMCYLFKSQDKRAAS